jgi:hypothetical protein
MSERGTSAIAIASLAIYPVALVFVMARSLLAGDLRELFAAPFSALVMTFVGYPVAVVVGWLLLRAAPALVTASLIRGLGAGAVSAEVAFWILIHPFWQRDYSNSFCAALVAACGLAVATVFQRLNRKTGHS